MADFRQLAVEFVLADDDAQQTQISRRAASEIINASPDTNPVARWVESVQPWMPGNQDDVLVEGQGTPDWSARAKALEFLSRTLRHLDANVLKSSQVKLLVAFFGAMFDVDHTAGVSASATALSHIVSLKSFAPSSGGDIVEKICALRDDFPRQLSKTRLEVYELVRLILKDNRVANDLQKRDGGSLAFVSKLLQLCSAERDPDCLMIWFDITQHLITHYTPSEEILEKLFSNFKSYFPITLPRTSQTGVTPEELKLALRKCFSSSSLLSAFTVPFLLGKLDQGDTLTVNVKLDILRTLKACFEEYGDVNSSIKPFVTQVWTSLKYEVRNGEIEDTIWATLEVLKTVATRLTGDALRDYTLTVTRDSVPDLSNPNYAAQAGRLCISVLSASPAAFVLMVSPSLTHIKENLRHPKSAVHTEDLHKILHIILESRIMVAELSMTSEERNDFGAVDPAFTTIYEDVYRSTLSTEKLGDSQQDDMKTAAQVVQGAGALVCQPTVATIQGSPDNKKSRLLSDETCSQICEALFAVTLHGCMAESRTSTLDTLVNEATHALQRSVVAYPAAFKSIVTRSMQVINSAWANPTRQSIQSIETLGPLVAYVGCVSLPVDLSLGMDQFLLCALAFTQSLISAIEARTLPPVWVALAASLQALFRSFRDACESLKTDTFEVTRSAWLSYISERYPSLRHISQEGVAALDINNIQTAAVDERTLHVDFLLITLYIARVLYRKTVAYGDVDGHMSFWTRPEITSKDEQSQQHYIHQISTIAGLVLHEMTETQQAQLQVEKDALHLFTDSDVGDTSIRLYEEAAGVLQHGLLQSLRSSSITRLFDDGKGQMLLKSGSSPLADGQRPNPVKMASLAVLANRYRIETEASCINDIEQGVASGLQALSAGENSSETYDSLQRLVGLQAIASGMLRRSPGKEAKGILQSLRDLPGAPLLGPILARRMDMITCPQEFLEKKSFATVKPLWMQKAYFELIQPMINRAADLDTENGDSLVRLNYGVSVLLMLQHMKFAIFEQDVSQVVRISIFTAEILETGQDVKAALLILLTVLHEAADALSNQLSNLLQICIKTFAGRPPKNRPSWLPTDYVPPLSKQNRAKVEAECSDLSLQIVAAIPSLFEERYLIPVRSSAERELTMACGHKIRKVRQTARLARQNWTETK